MDWLSERQLASAALDALTSNICVVDRSGTIVAANETWRRFSRDNDGQEDFVGENYIDICMKATGRDAQTANRFGAAIVKVLAGECDHFEVEYPCHGSRERRWFLARVTPLRSKEYHAPKPIAAIISHQNITERKTLELKLRRLADTDELTGIPNRRKFMSIAATLMDQIRVSNKPASLIGVDLDRFKTINDTYGHGVGDEVLCFVVDMINSGLRSVDTLARTGGEEFSILLPDTDEWGAIMVAERLRESVSAASFATDNQSIRLTINLGVTALDPKEHSLDAALSRADSAMYKAKHAGRNRVISTGQATVSEHPGY